MPEFQVTCPKCGKVARSLGTTNMRDLNQTLPIYQCDECTMGVPYPGESGGRDTEWPLEFVVTEEGEKVLARPTADWFA